MEQTIETFDVQNILARIERNIYLNIDNPPPSLKKQFAKVRKGIVALHLEVDLLNDMKEEHNGNK